jgi:hypothetical protein
MGSCKGNAVRRAPAAWGPHRGPEKNIGAPRGRPETTISQEVTHQASSEPWSPSCGEPASDAPCQQPSCGQPSCAFPSCDGPSCDRPSCGRPVSSLLASYLTTFLSLVRRISTFRLVLRPPRALSKLPRRASPALRRAAYADQNDVQRCDASSQLRRIEALKKSRQQKTARFTTFLVSVPTDPRPALR